MTLVTQTPSNTIPNNKPRPQLELNPGQQAQTPYQRTTVLDRLMESILGTNEGPQSQYALICSFCFTHNGLVMPEEYRTTSESKILL